MPGLYGSSGLSTLPLFFHFHDGIPLTNADVVACVHQTLYEADLVHHTTLAKIGVATSVAQAGIFDSIIKALGR